MYSAVIFVMDAESEYEIERARDAIQMIETIQSMIDVSADRLEGLRTQCFTSAELTQQEIRTLEVRASDNLFRENRKGKLALESIASPRDSRTCPQGPS